MNKELEVAIKIIKDETLYDSSNNRCPYVKDLPQWKIIEQALTPPTEEEVCEALSEYYGFEVVHEGLDFIPKIEHDYYYEVVSVADNRIVFTAPLPPHLVTMIGRFYEGLNDE